MSRTLKGIAAAAAAAAIALGATVLASSASAHTPEVVADCDSVSVSLTNYETGNVIVTIDGVAESFDFEGSFSKTWDLAGTGHTYSVVVDAPGTEFDRTFDATVAACPTPEPSQPPATETPTPSPSPSTGIGTPEYPPSGQPEDVYVPSGPGPEETATPGPIPEDSEPGAGEDLAVTGPDIRVVWLAVGAVAIGGTLVAVSRLRRRVS
jgi:hypothetical protein